MISLAQESGLSSATGRLELFGDLSLSDPWFLALVPAAVAAAWMGRARRRYATAHLPGLHPSALHKSLRQRLAWIPPAFSVVAMLLAVLALARPLSGRLRLEDLSEGVDIVLLLDQSTSMDNRQAENEPRRFDVARSVLGAFAERRMNDTEGASDSVALVGFAGFAEMLCPFTLDSGVLIEILGELDVAPRELDGTRIGVAITKAVELYEDFDATSKVVILLTDGLESDNPPITPLDAAQLAAEAGVKIYVVFAGPKEGIYRLGPRRVKREIPTDELERIAELTGGQFFHAEDATQLEDVYLAIEALERRKREDVTYADHFDLYPRLLIPAFVLYLLSWLSACTWARRLP